VLDAATATMNVGVIEETGSLSELRTLLAHTSPSEILVGPLPEPVMRCIKDPAVGAEVTPVVSSDFPAPEAAANELAAKSAFAAAAQAVGTLGAAAQPPQALSALVGLLGHLQRLKMLELLGACVQV
jgi:hypothetical protein